jgi:predicted permease
VTGWDRKLAGQSRRLKSRLEHLGMFTVRYAARSLTKAAGFSTLVVLTLGAGISAVTTMFTIVDGVLLKPLRFRDPDRLVSVITRYTGRRDLTLTGGDAIDISAEPRIFAAFAYYQGGEMGVQLGEHAEFVGVRRVHVDFFRVFGMQPVAGRLLNRDDAERSAVVALSFAARNFGTAAAALHHAISIEERRYEIVAVMPASMTFPEQTEIWTAGPLAPSNRNRTGFNYRGVGRLAPGVSLQQANDRLASLSDHLAAVFPVSNDGKKFVAVPLREAVVGQTRPMLWVLMAAVALLLLIACANAANLFLARASSRTAEIAVRSALGASRRQIVAELLAESLVLAVLAAGLGVFAANVGTTSLLRIGAHSLPLPRLDDIHMDWRVALFAVALCGLTSLAFGLAPALQASRVTAAEALKRGGGRGAAGSGLGRLGMRGALVVAQIALSCTLVASATLFFRSLASLERAGLGYDRSDVLVMYAHAPARGSIFASTGLDNYLQAGRALDEVVARLRQLPNVTAAGAAMGLPTGQYDSNGSYAVEGKHVFAGDFRKLPSAGFRLASPRYFGTLHIPLLRGRDFNDSDVYDRPFVAIISESLARETFGNEDPLGHRIVCGLDQPDRWMTIVGVVGDVRQASPAAQPKPELYMPLRQHPYVGNEVQVVARTSGRPRSLIPAVQQVVRTVDADIATKFTTLDDSVDASIAAPRFRATLAAVFASLAVLFALAGIYSLMSYITAQRTAEFGLRMALGAEPRDLLRLVLAKAGRLAIAGAAIGLALAFAASRAIAGLLVGIAPTDPLTYIAVLLAGLPVVVGAASLPALRAARTDPSLALRGQ